MMENTSKMSIITLLDQHFYTMLTVSTVLLLVLQYLRSSAFRYYFKFTYFTIHSAIAATIFIPVMLLRPRDSRNALLPAWGLRQMKKWFGLNWTVRGHENIVKDSGCVVVMNHQSAIDLIALAEIWPVMPNCTVISKKEIFYLWPFGLATYLWGTIFIDRLNPNQSRGTINSTGKIIKDRKARVCMFPEGTRHGGLELLPFKKGAFHVAIASQTPIQPVVISRYYYLDGKHKIFDSGRTVIEILPEISTEGLNKDDIEDLIGKTHRVMQEKYIEISKEVLTTNKTGQPVKYDMNENKKAS